jgi:hypothetical protein
MHPNTLIVTIEDGRCATVSHNLPFAITVIVDDLDKQSDDPRITTIFTQEPTDNASLLDQLAGSDLVA